MAMDETAAKRFDASMPPHGLNVAQTARTAVQSLVDTDLIIGVVTVADGSTSGTTTVDAKFDGAMVFLTLREAPGSAGSWFGSVANGTVTVTVAADPGKDLAFNYLLIQNPLLGS